MYQAKESGKGRYAIFDPSMRDAVAEAPWPQGGARSAAVERGQLVVEYQPIVALESGDVTRRRGTGALEPPGTRAACCPSEFVPLAEETGLIVALGQYVLEEACRRRARGRRRRAAGRASACT